MFQHTAARRRLLSQQDFRLCYQPVSTHSRAEAAAKYKAALDESPKVSTHSRAEAAAL